MRIIQIPLRYSNAYLVIDQQAILVDAGFPGDADVIERAITRAGLTPRDITLLVHTHVHSHRPTSREPSAAWLDTTGSSRQVLRRLRAPNESGSSTTTPIRVRRRQGVLPH